MQFVIGNGGALKMPTGTASQIIAKKTMMRRMGQGRAGSMPHGLGCDCPAIPDSVASYKFVSSRHQAPPLLHSPRDTVAGCLSRAEGIRRAVAASPAQDSCRCPPAA